MYQLRVLKNAIIALTVIFLLNSLLNSVITTKHKKPRLYESDTNKNLWVDNSAAELKTHQKIVKEYFDKRQNWSTSNLGTILFKNGKHEDYKIRDKNFTVLIYKHWNWLQKRHLMSFSNTLLDPLSECSVKNCKFFGNDSMIEKVDAVFVHLQKGIIPRNVKRRPEQIWIFATDESPKHVFSLSSKRNKISDLGNMFNWSMNYRHDADIPVPYGRVIPFLKSMNDEVYKTVYTDQDISAPIDEVIYAQLMALVPNFNDKLGDVHVTTMYSNCLSERQRIIKELSKYMEIHVYGGCSDNEYLKESCPGHFKADCSTTSYYTFYLVMENSQCTEYLTEKVFYHAYAKGLIPVIFGASVEDCKMLLPPLSYIHADNFDSLEDLAKEIIKTANSNHQKLEYHKWRTDFDVVNEHGYFGTRSQHFCRICEGLNYNDDKPKVYDKSRLMSILDYKTNCKSNQYISHRNQTQ